MMENATVLGASGALGKAVTDALISRNIPTKILVRSKEKYLSLYPGGNIPGQVEVIEGDLDSNLALATVLEFTETVFLCYNTPYHRWSKDMVRWTARVSDLAAALQARLVFPGNVYNFGKTGAQRVNEEYPQNTHTEKGQLRIALEQRMARAAMEGATLTILRLPEVYGPAVFMQNIMPIFQSALQNKTCRWYGNPQAMFEFVSTIDAGEAMVQAALEPKAADTVLHLPGPEAITAHDWISMIYKEAGANLEQIYSITSKWTLRFAGIFNKQAAEFIEMLHLYEEPVLMDGTKFKQIVGPSPVRSYQETIKETIEWYKYWFAR
ncbi:MAG: NmrA family NAD(P)-binding protein [Candidatus Kariarchaeaceae archaeon]|jgi:nucleoside-diphosphate-sugar epimerase